MGVGFQKGIKYFTILVMSTKLKLKIRVPGWHDPGVLPAG